MHRGRGAAALLVAALWLAAGSAAFATASGPDFFRVVGIEPGGVLEIRAAASAETRKIGEIPAGADGIRNLGCEGGMSFAEWEAATEAERAAAAKTRWCRVEYRGVEGWVAGWQLGEGSAPEAARGTLWRILLLDGEPVAAEAELGFSPDGRIHGTLGCNRFRGEVAMRDSALVSDGPLVATRMACVDPGIGRQEARLVELLAEAPEISYDPVRDRLTLLGADGTPAALLERKPAE